MGYFVPVAIVSAALIGTGAVLYVASANRRMKFQVKRREVMSSVAREVAAGVIDSPAVTENLRRALLDRSMIYSPNRSGGNT